MKTKFLLWSIPCLLLFSACDEIYYHDEPAAYRGSTVDFYYVSGRPYSRSYGPLYSRQGRYYYSRGGRDVVYDRPTTVVVRRDGDRDDRRDRRDRWNDDDRRGYQRNRDESDRREWRGRERDRDDDDDRVRRRGLFGLFP